MDNIVGLFDEDGNEVLFEFLDLICLDGETYIVLLPAQDEENEEDEEDAEEVIMLKVVDFDGKSGEGTYETLEDEALINRVFAIFRERNRDIYNFVDEG